MLEIFTGIISGTISGTGMGGGTILILILSIFIGVEQHVAQATNLVFFVPTAITAIITTMKGKLVNWKIGITVAIYGVIGAVFGAKISVNMNVDSLRKYFGMFLITIAIYEIYSLVKEYKINKKKHNKKEKIDKL